MKKSNSSFRINTLIILFASFIFATTSFVFAEEKVDVDHLAPAMVKTPALAVGSPVVVLTTGASTVTTGDKLHIETDHLHTGDKVVIKFHEAGHPDITISTPITLSATHAGLDIPLTALAGHVGITGKVIIEVTDPKGQTQEHLVAGDISTSIDFAVPSITSTVAGSTPITLVDITTAVPSATDRKVIVLGQSYKLKINLDHIHDGAIITLPDIIPVTPYTVTPIDVTNGFVNLDIIIPATGTGSITGSLDLKVDVESQDKTQNIEHKVALFIETKIDISGLAPEMTLDPALAVGSGVAFIDVSGTKIYGVFGL